jgi:hypothetical protein
MLATLAAVAAAVFLVVAINKQTLVLRRLAVVPLPWHLIRRGFLPLQQNNAVRRKINCGVYIGRQNWR